MSKVLLHKLSVLLANEQAKLAQQMATRPLEQRDYLLAVGEHKGLGKALAQVSELRSRLEEDDEPEEVDDPTEPPSKPTVRRRPPRSWGG